MKDGSKRLVRNGGSTGPLTVKRGGEYWKAFIQDQRVYKTAGHVGTYEVLKINVAKFGDIFPGQEGAFMVPGTYQLNLFVKLLDPHALYEFGYPNYNTFGRQILVGFDVLPTDEAADVAAKVYEALDLAIRREEMIVGGLDESNNATAIVPFEEDATVVALQAGHYALRFEAVGLALYDETTCDSCVGEYLPTIDIFKNANGSINAASVVTPGVEPFATGEWLIENLRFPSYPNIRWAAVGEDNRPIPGAQYTMYSFSYESPRPGLGGLSGVGQKMEGVSRHVYYVHSSAVSAFETLLANLGTVTATTASGAPNAKEVRSEQAVVEKADA